MLFFVAAWQRTIYNFNLAMHFNACEYLWGCNLSDFLRQIVNNDEGHNISNTYSPVSMLITESNYQNNMSN